MQLNSVRELKQALFETLVENLPVMARSRAAFGTPARAVAVAAEVPKTLVLGVARYGKSDYRLAVRVQHRAMESCHELDIIRKQAKGEMDLRYIGSVVKRAVPWRQKRNRPLRMGGSIGHYKVTAGTLGCFVRSDDDILILSNNHVLANENDAKEGDYILQPGRVDDGKNPRDAIGKLVKFVKLKRRGANTLDCAVASVKEGIRTSRRNLTGLGKLAGLGDVFLDEGTKVSKIGRTTGLTHGRVTAFELDNVVVEYDMGDLRFDNQIEIEGEGDNPFSEGGDSGALIVSEDLRALALLFAGSDQGGANGQGLTYANPIRDVLEALRVQLVF